jgi:hypothetical protein
MDGGIKLCNFHENVAPTSVIAICTKIEYDITYVNL